MRRSATVEGIERSWIEQGEGVPFVLVHGIPSSLDLWRKVIPLLPSLFRTEADPDFADRSCSQANSEMAA